MHRRDLSLPVAIMLSWVLGTVPFSQLAAMFFADTDLRQHGTGTVSGTGLYQVAGFGPLAIAGSLDVAKGAIIPALLKNNGRAAALAGALAISGHNWSPWLKGSGGRGLSPALGVCATVEPRAAILLLFGLGAGRASHQTGLGTFVSLLALFPLLVFLKGSEGMKVALALVIPIFVKRLMGNQPPDPLGQKDLVHIFANRLLFDHDYSSPTNNSPVQQGASKKMFEPTSKKAL